MKKIIGVLGIAILAMAIFFSTNSLSNSVGDLDLADLVGLNNANAECGPAPSCDSVCGWSTITTCYLRCEGNQITCIYSYPR